MRLWTYNLKFYNLSFYRFFGKNPPPDRIINDKNYVYLLNFFSKNTRIKQPNYKEELRLAITEVERKKKKKNPIKRFDLFV